MSGKLDCPFCEYSGRADNVKRHIAANHPMATCVNVSLPNGCIYRPTTRKPYVVVSLASDGSAKSGGYCFRCNELIPHMAGATMNLYAGHPCKLGKGGKILPIPDTSFLTPETVDSTPDNINWDLVINDIQTNPTARKVLDMKRIREIPNEDDSSTTISLDPRATIMAAITCDGILKRCMRAEREAADFKELYEKEESKVSGLEQQIIDLDSEKENIKKEYSRILGKAYQDLEAANARIAELTTPPIIDHTS